ncbi:hypothetical protein OG689_10450 [Kitasatospora sp. NBC_00240]|uniref:hypothetical protein n=1 Tax=Kitasatospora sp. NBC_00240 TaxID=2903567 RepID=UPI002251F017|nr:hypothetical protein [Kitasatospora sp. NBC_00240]MCX5209702.1 hypothetical protein [Kitasatospora sp. NBC_00240]
MTIKPTPRSLARTSLLSGLVAISLAVALDNVVLAIVSLTAVIAGIAAVVTHIIDQAIRDTGEERRRLQSALTLVEEERMRLVAARAAVDADAERVVRHAAWLEADTRIRLAAERAELEAEFEDKRASLKQEGFFLGLDYNDRGVLDNALRPHVEAKVLRLPVAAVGSTAGHGAYSPS